MPPDVFNRPFADRAHRFFAAGFALFLTAVAGLACSGRIGDATGVGPGMEPPPSLPPPPPQNLPQGASDPGAVAIHRLNGFEYDNTINDLLGLSQDLAQRTFIPDQVGSSGFDNEASAFRMSDAEFEQYFDAADALAEQAFADPALAARIVTCTPAAAADATCLGDIINQFGQRAYRRPLAPDEVSRFQALAADALQNGEDFPGAVKQIVKAMLSSLQFLYRIEIDPDPSSRQAHRLGAYELANRLSYLLWSSMPDAPLFAAAQAATLVDDAMLSVQVDRMLQDPRANNFVASFAGQWLGMRALSAHQVEATAFKNWNEPLRQAMVQEVALFFNEFLNGDLPWTQFLTAPVHFVNGPLAALYGFPNIAATETQMTRVDNADPRRIGFLGLGAFLTQSSFSYRTVPTLRGKWVYENLLGEDIPAPPANVPPLDAAKNAATDVSTQEENVRERLVAHRTDPACAACHALLDPIGLGLENFDGIGAYRSAYGNGQAIDASGLLPDGTKFDGLIQLASALSQGAKQTELVNFAARQLMTYAISRSLNLLPPASSDGPFLAQIQQQWAKQDYRLKSLLKDVVLSETFRSRRGGD